MTQYNLEEVLYLVYLGEKLFIFKWKNPPPAGKKINLKDYYF